MENILYSMAGILIPFLGTSLGSSFVFFMRKDMRSNLKKLIVGFAAGVMMAASVWSLILPSVEMAESQGAISWVPAAVGFAIGVIFLLLINTIAEKIEEKGDGKKLNMLTFSVTLHNIPERNGSRCMLCRISSWKCRNCIVRGNCFSRWNCHSKYSRTEPLFRCHSK